MAYRILVALSLTTCITAAYAGPPIPTFTDETDSRLVADPPVGSDDDSEKDYGLGDFDGDGDMDIVAARRIGLNFNNDNPLPNTLFMNENGVLVDRTADLAPSMLVSRISRDALVIDVDNDGLLDVIIADGTSNPPRVHRNLGFSGDSGAWLGFDDSTSTAFPGSLSTDAWTVAGGDLVGDGDGYPDLFIGARIGTDKLMVNMGSDRTGWLGFTDATQMRLGSNSLTSATRSATITDVNADGDEDIIGGVTNPEGFVRILPNNGSGVFTGSGQIVFSGQAYNHAVGDLDGNGVLDFYGVRNSLDQVRLNLGPGSGESIQLGSTITVPGSSGFGSIVRVDDLNGDGTDDFLLCDLDQEFPQDCSRRLKFYFNSGVSPFLTQGYPGGAPWAPNGTSDVAMLDLDGDGDLDMFIGHCDNQSVFMQDGSPEPSPDLNGDGAVDGADLGLLLGSWGACEGCPADLNGDDVVDGADLGLLLGAWTG